MDRLIKIKQVRQNLLSGGSSIGSWMQIPHPSIAEIMGQAGYDWIAIDMEHGAISHSQLPDLFRALEIGGTLPLVRLSDGATKECKQVLDAGAGGVIVPMVETPEQLELVRSAICWPPAGTRGVGYSRANLFGKHFEKYSIEAQSPLLIAQIEHIKALDKLADILQVHGLDAVMVGPYDLSASMGLTGKFQSTHFKNSIKFILDSCQQCKIPAGLHIVKPEPSELIEKINEGYQFLAYSIDAVFLDNYCVRPKHEGS